MKIIGISGKKSSGKDTAMLCLTDHLEELDYIPEHVRFAGGLKEIMRRCFGLVNQDSQISKDEVMLNNETVRSNQQKIGTDVMRAIDPDCWVNWWKTVIDELNFFRGADCVVIVPDVRFPNEVKAIHDLGGHVIRLTRTPFPEDKHESETALDEMEKVTIWSNENGYDHDGFDAIIDNANMSIEEQNKAVLEIVTERKWV